MSERQRTCIAIDLKSYYASVECMARGLDPMTTNLVVADISRTEKTICLAVSPSLKAYGSIGSRTFWHQRDARRSLTCSALNRISSLEYMMLRRFFRLWRLWLAAST